MEEISHNGRKREIVKGSISLDIKFAKLIFIPGKDLHGNISIEITFYDALKNLTSPVKRNIFINVLSVNDPPRIGSARSVMLPQLLIT